VRILFKKNLVAAAKQVEIESLSKIKFMRTLHALLALFLVTIAIGYISCQKDLKGDTVVNIIPVDDQTKVTASVEGYITNEKGQPVNGATVTSGSANTSTDIKGYFRFNNIQLSKNNGYVKVNMPGYFTGSRSFVTNAGRVNHVLIQLIPKIKAGNINAAAGGSVTLSSGIVISLPAGSVVNASTNAAYTGTVNIAAAWIDPTGTVLTEQMPGDLRGIKTDGSEAGLQTFGMVTVELTGSGGELLQIATGKKATLHFTIPVSLASSAPGTVPLWYFDETAGRWKEEGTATKNGNTYVANVNHFSTWNCDASFPLVEFSARLITDKGSPLVNATIKIRMVSNNAFGIAITDSAGFLHDKIPANETLVLEVYDQCNSVIYSQNLGPFSSNVSLGNITVINTTTQLITVSGTLNDCNNLPVANGYVEVGLGSRNYRLPVNNGSYSATLVNCGYTSLRVFGVDNNVNQQSATQTIAISSQNVVIPVLKACGTSSMQRIDWTIDGRSYSLTSPPDSIGIDGNGTNGHFIWGWTRNFTIEIRITIKVTSPSPGTYPLTLVHSMHDTTDLDISSSPFVTITEYGAVGEFISGNFSANVRNLNDSSLHPITCTFRVRRRL